MTSKLRDLRCRCGHDKAQHKPLDTLGLEWCRGCGCSMFEPLHTPEPPEQPPATQYQRIADAINTAYQTILTRPWFQR